MTTKAAKDSAIFKRNSAAIHQQKAKGQFKISMGGTFIPETPTAVSYCDGYYSKIQARVSNHKDFIDSKGLE
jgi:hypothetical protein